MFYKLLYNIKYLRHNLTVGFELFHVNRLNENLASLSRLFYHTPYQIKKLLKLRIQDGRKLAIGESFSNSRMRSIEIDDNEVKVVICKLNMADDFCYFRSNLFQNWELNLRFKSKFTISTCESVFIIRIIFFRQFHHWYSPIHYYFFVLNFV